MVWQRVEIAGGLNIGHHPEITPGLGKGLDQQARAAVAPVTQANGDGLAWAQIAAMLANGQNFPPWPLATHARIFQR